MSPVDYARGGPRPDPGTLTQLFFESAERYDKRDAMLVKIDGVYRPISHRQILERVRHLAEGLRGLGLTRGERVGILSETRYEWALADYACLCAGLTDVPVYPSLPPEQITPILEDSGAVVLFVSTAAQARKIVAIRAQLPRLRLVISFEPAEGAADFTLAEVEARGRVGETDDSIRRHRDDALAARPDDLATIIYTSGTTGKPKGVMLTHDNLYSNVRAALRALPVTDDIRSLSFLPLAHVFERMAGHYLMFAAGTTIAYAESIDSVTTNLAEVRPTILLGVPRFYEKVYARVKEKAAAAGGVKRAIFDWADGIARRAGEQIIRGRRPTRALALQHALATRLVFSKIHATVGGRLQWFVSGGAPLSSDLNRFYHGAGFNLLEGYGLTETSPVITVNTPQERRLGTVGRPIDGVEIRIVPVPDFEPKTPGEGEILARGPNVMKGYYNNPEATAEVLEPDGWFHTGDVGVLEDGFLRITDRKKDLIVTAGGKNIAPQPIENALKANRFVNQAVMVGDRRKFPIMLIAPRRAELEQWARAEKIAFASWEELAARPEVRELLEREVRTTLKSLAPFEMPKKVGVLPRELSVDAGELTLLEKVKRRVVEERYGALIESLYAEAPPSA